MKKLFVTTFLFTVLCCTNNEKSYYKLEGSNVTFDDFNHYTNERGLKDINTNVVVDTTYFVFANNPYKINNDSFINIYVSGESVFCGNFKESIPIDLSRYKDKSINISLELLTSHKDNNLNLNVLSNKNTIKWNNQKFLYTCFFPLNQNIDNVCFISSDDDIYW